MEFFPTNDINRIILRNLDKRATYISKFYSWLQINENTPIEVKLMVSDNYVFGAIFYQLHDNTTNNRLVGVL